ncbi:hypothetical protein [Lactococcus taiwanensis]|uniref:hypothetical protein n=1 Tax=Lactococcus taiwanensis TaxID=1151742 RepID=UPI001962A424|nr:hypothetical protein [Lactococcus taiwanensis]QRZ11945.1 hypothetical protein JVB21_04690 [Lactococcus taiwanensis]
MRQKHIEYATFTQKDVQKSGTNPINREKVVMKLLVESYMHGAQTCEVENGNFLGVSIHHGICDHIHFFINDSHKVTVEISQGTSRITVMSDKELGDAEYIIPFIRCLGIPEGQILENGPQI